MPEINLPTKTTQDSIKSDTVAILGNFPIVAGGGDNKTNSYLTAKNVITVAGNIKTSVLNITGKGVLKRIRVNLTDASNTYLANTLIRVDLTVDGVLQTLSFPLSAIEGALFGIGGDSTTPLSSIVEYIPNVSFDTSLKLEIYHTHTANGNIRYFTEYGLT